MVTNPLLDVVPLPYSSEVLESYRILTDALETRIPDIVENKIESISMMSSIPNRAFDDVYKFQITTEIARDMKWYIDLIGR